MVLPAEERSPVTDVHYDINAAIVSVLAQRGGWTECGAVKGLTREKLIPFPTRCGEARSF